MPPVITVEQFIQELASDSKRVTFEGRDRRGCALENNIFAFVHFEICCLVSANNHHEDINKINNSDTATSTNDVRRRRFCRISQLELNEGNARSGASQLPQVAAFPLDEDEYIFRETKNKHQQAKQSDVKSSSSTEQEQQQQEQHQQQERKSVALTNIELVGCPTGVLIWRPGKQRHFFLRTRDGYLISLWTENPAVHACVSIEKDPSLQQYFEEINATHQFHTAVHFLTENNLIEGFNLNKVTPTLIALRVFRAKLNIPIRSVFPVESHQHHHQTTSKKQTSDLISNQQQNHHSASVISATTAASSSFLSNPENNSLLSHSPSRFGSNNNNNINRGTSFISNFVASTEKHRQRQLYGASNQNDTINNGTPISSLHAVSFCEVPTHKLLNMKTSRFLLQIAEAKEVFAFALPSISSSEEEDFESHNHFHPVTKSTATSPSFDDFGSNSALNIREGNLVGHMVGRLINVLCHHVQLREDDYEEEDENDSDGDPRESEDDENDGNELEGKDGEVASRRTKKTKKTSSKNSVSSSVNARKNVTIPIRLNSDNTVPAQCSAMHCAIVDVQAGTCCLMLSRRGANAAEFFLFSEHCILRTLSPKTSSGHHSQLLLTNSRKSNSNKNKNESDDDEEHISNNDITDLASSMAQRRSVSRNQKQQNNGKSGADRNEDDDDASMFLYDSIPLVSSSSRSTQVRCSVSVANPNFFVLSYSNTNETDRVLNFAICLPVFDRRRKLWTACVASHKKLWKGETIPVLGGDPYPPSPLCCPLPSGYIRSDPVSSSSSSATTTAMTTRIVSSSSSSSSGRIQQQQHLPGSDQLAIFDYHDDDDDDEESSISSVEDQSGFGASVASATTTVSFVNWTDLWTATVYSRLDENGATFTATKLDQDLQPCFSDGTDTQPIISIITRGNDKREINLSELLQLASRQATSVFAQARHGLLDTSSSSSSSSSSPFILPSHELVHAKLSLLEQNSLALLEHSLNQRHCDAGKRLGEVVLTKIGKLAHSTTEFEKKIENASLQSHEEFFRSQGVDVITNTLHQLEETRNMLRTLRLALEDAEEERKSLEDEEDEDHDQFLRELLDKASTPDPTTTTAASNSASAAYRSMKSKWV